MPTPSATPTGGSPGGVPPGSTQAVKDLLDVINKLTDAEKEQVKSAMDMEKTYRSSTAALIATKDEIKKLITEKNTEISVTAKGTARYKELEKECKALNAELKRTEDRIKHVTEQMEREQTVIYKVSAAVKKHGQVFHDIAKPINESLKSYHSYNMEIQRSVEMAGRSAGSYAKITQQFRDFRNELDLTRKAGLEVIETFTTGLRLGATNQQLTQVAQTLKGIYGTAQGMKMLGEIIKMPMTGRAMQNVMQGQRADPAQLLRTLRTATPAQMQAITAVAERQEGVPGAQRGARFEAKQAQLTKIKDDIQLGMEAALDASLGPEVGAVLGPLSEMREDLSKLLGVVESGFQFLKTVTGVGAGIGGIGKFVAPGGGMAGRIGGGLAVGGAIVAGGYGLDAAAKGMPEGAGKEWTKVGGLATRLAGYTAGGAMMGGPVGALGGAVAGGATELATNKEYGGQFKRTWGFNPMDWVTGGAEAPEEEETAGKPAGAVGQFRDFFLALKTLDEQIAQVGTDIAGVPENIAAEVELSRLPTALASIDPRRMFQIGEAAALGFDKSMDEATKSWDFQLQKIDQFIETVRAQKPEGGELSVEGKKRTAILQAAEARRNELANQNIRATMEASPLRRAAAGAMQRLDTRTGQIGMEREAGRAEFQRTGAITGNLEDINKFQEQLAKGYEETLVETEVAAHIQEQSLVKERDRLNAMVNNNKLNKNLRDVAFEQMQSVENQLEINKKTLRLKQGQNRVEAMNAELEMLRYKINSAESSAVFRRAQRTQELAKAQESFARERGATPGEVGALAQTQANQANTMLNQFRKTIPGIMEELQNRLEDAVSAGDEGRAVQIEQEIFNIKNKELELTRTEFAARIHGATAAAQLAGEQAGVQKSMLEVMRDTAARTGQSWRVQMQYQSQIIQASRVDLEAAREVFEKARAAGDSGLPLMQKQLAVIQKESALREAIMGKQRDFLEKAVGRSFGMGGGSKALPNFSPRVFGEIVKDVTGGQWQGAPKTIEETRQAMGGNIFGAIPGGEGVPGVQPQGIGVGGRINPAAIRPGVNPALRGLAPGLPGAEGPQVAGGPAGIQGGDRLGLDVAVVVKSDNPLFTAQVESAELRSRKKANSRGHWS